MEFCFRGHRINGHYLEIDMLYEDSVRNTKYPSQPG